MAITLNGTSGIIGGINSMTAQNSTSGTSIDFTSIPSGVKRITVMLYGVSTNGTASLRFQLGSGGITTTGYSSTCIQSGASTAYGTSSTGFDGQGDTNAAFLRSGVLTFNLITGNTWTMNGIYNIGVGQNYVFTFAGSVPLGGTLDRVRITTTNGTDAFDAGSINVLYE